MIGMILAAGLGTRLRPLTDHVAKPAVPVANRPLAAFAMERLRGAGVTELRANVFHHAHATSAALRAIEPGLRVCEERALLGTGGGLRNALSDMAEEVVVMNGDVLFDVDLGAAIAAHRAADAFATMVVRTDARAEAMGAVRVSDEGHVRAVAGLPDVPNTGTHAFAFSGVHVLSARALRALPESGCVIRGGYHAWIARGERVIGVRDEGRWADLGTHAAYLEANVALASGAWPWPGLSPDPRGIVHGSARVGDAMISASVIGEGVTFAPGVAVSRCAIWPGTHVGVSVRDAIVTPFARIDRE